MSEKQNEIRKYVQKHKASTDRAQGKKPDASKTQNALRKVTIKKNHGVATHAYRQKVLPPKVKLKPSMEGLPDELIFDIFGYLGPTDLFSCARVCKRWSYLAKDNVLWQAIYRRYANDLQSAASNKNGYELGSSKTIGPSEWKALCVKRCTEVRNKSIIPMLKKLDAFTGLPANTKPALDKACVHFLLCFEDRDGIDHVIQHSDVYHFRMSVCARWYGMQIPPITRVHTLKIFAANPVFYDKKGKAVKNSPYQRSLLFESPFKWDEWTKTTPPQGSDNLIDVHIIPGGLLIATWKEEKDIAFITANFHAHNLVKRCIMGSSSSPYLAPKHKAKPDDIDSKYGLHDYTCTLELRNMRTSFWTEQYRNLYTKEGDLGGGCARLVLIDPDNEYERSSLSKEICFRWKTDALKGIVQNVCFMDLTLLDEQSKPMWCVSACVNMTSHVSKHVTYAFDGDKLQIVYDDEKGKVVFQLSWEQDESTYYVIGLEVFLKLEHINNWFGTKY